MPGIHLIGIKDVGHRRTEIVHAHAPDARLVVDGDGPDVLVLVLVSPPLLASSVVRRRRRRRRRVVVLVRLEQTKEHLRIARHQYEGATNLLRARVGRRASFGVEGGGRVRVVPRGRCRSRSLPVLLPTDLFPRRINGPLNLLYVLHGGEYDVTYRSGRLARVDDVARVRFPHVMFLRCRLVAPEEIHGEKGPLGPVQCLRARSHIVKVGLNERDSIGIQSLHGPGLVAIHVSRRGPNLVPFPLVVEQSPHRAPPLQSRRPEHGHLQYRRGVDAQPHTFERLVVRMHQ
mmetsp:Transcript_3644/g.9797  ORF Transcript_3644/g.9797 Transcript_3644/m.9797 type:complete len:288 (-) Transcript_3644:1048-1911(-)